MKPMTPEQLQAIRERAEKATPPPWKTWGMQVLADPKNTSDLKDGIPVADTHCRNRGGRPSAFDAEFIAAARTDVPDLLAHIAELEAKASGWQAIESAPKDSEGVLLWSPQYGVCHAFWNEYARGSRGGWLIVHDNGDGWGAVEPNDATHWQPLPAPPAPTANEKA